MEIIKELPQFYRVFIEFDSDNNKAFMIHRNKLTKAEILWQGIVFWSIVYTAIEAAFSYTFETPIKNWQIFSDLLVASIFVADIFYQFRDKIREKQREDFSNSTDKFKWALNLAVDIFSSIPFDVVAYYFALGNGYQAFYALRFTRMYRIGKNFNLFGSISVIPSYVKFQFLIVMCMVAIHFISCGWVMINPEPAMDDVSEYIKALYWTTTTLTTIGYGDIVPTTNGGRLYTMVIMILGVGVYGIVIGNVAKMLSDRDRYKEQAREKVNDLNNFMKYYNVPDRISGAVFNYYNHLLQKRLTDNDNHIISDLPTALQQELQTFMNIKLIRNVPLFKTCSQACLKDVASRLEQLYYSPGQTVINTGEIGNEMYIVGHGIVEVILKDGNSVASLHEGQFFGEVALLRETKRSANVRAQTYCDLYKLKKDDFIEIIRRHPELLEKVEGVANKRSSDRRERPVNQAA